jgi:sulfite exporter TauE/SafE
MASLLPFFLAGLAGSVHCAGMCGGIVTAISLHGRRTIPIAVAGAPALGNGLAYNGGRIASYMAAGALAGGIAPQAGSLLLGLPAWQAAAAWAANSMLVLLGLYLMGAQGALAWAELAGGALWRRIRPLTGRLGQGGPGAMFMLGGIWGWLPCGMVYSVLTSALLAGSAAGGAAVMLAFGLGTLPMMLAIGAGGAKAREFIQQPQVRMAAGLLVLGFGVLGFWRASGHLPAHWLPAWCLP